MEKQNNTYSSIPYPEWKNKTTPTAVFPSNSNGKTKQHLQQFSLATAMEKQNNTYSSFP